MKSENQIRELLEEDSVAFGVQVASFSPTIIELCGELGVDYVWLDMEHKGPSPYDSDAVEELARTAEAGGVELVVRIPSGDPPLIRKVLDAGLRNIVIPQLRTPEEIRSAVHATRFTYEDKPGRRGVGVARSSVWGAEFDGYPDREDRSICIGFVLENREVVENADEILSIPEVGFVLVGMGDMSVSMGRPLEKDHPEVRTQEEELIRACEEHDVPMGKSVNSAEAACEAVEDGYQLVVIGRDVAVIRSAIGDRLDQLSEVI
jgi:2-dehydro-3-deoxyglucarate aldolase